MKTTIGEVQITDAQEYGYSFGCVIEMLGYWNDSDEPTWAIPAWDERGLGDLEGVFMLTEDAETALADYI